MDDQQPYPPPPPPPPPPGYGYPAYVPPDHPTAVTAFVLGMIAGPGSVLTCGLLLLAGPFAWFFGARARTEIRRSQGRFGGQGKATTGLVIGIVTTVLLVLVIAGLVALSVWAHNDPAGFDDFFGIDDGATV